MRPSRKVTIVGVTVLLAIGTVLWMRSLALWRPVKVTRVNPAYYNASPELISDDERTPILSSNVKGSFRRYQGAVAITHRKSLVVGFENGRTDEEPQNILRVRDLYSGQPKRTIPYPVASQGGWDAPDVLPSRDDRTVWVFDIYSSLFQFDIQTGRLLHRTTLKNEFGDGYSHPVLALSPDGARLFGCEHRETRIWDVASGNNIGAWEVKNPADLQASDFSPDARVVVFALCRTVVTGSHGGGYHIPTGIYVFMDAVTGKALWKNTVPFSKFKIWGDEVFVSGAKDCQVFDLYTGHLTRHLPGPTQDTTIMKITPDFIYTENSKGEIFRWRAR